MSLPRRPAATDNIRFVKVDTPTVDVNIFFSIPVLGLARAMTGTATAGLSVQTNVFCNFIPIAVVEGTFGGGIGWQDFNGDGVKDYATDCLAPPPGAAHRLRSKHQVLPRLPLQDGSWTGRRGKTRRQVTTRRSMPVSGAHDLKLAIAGGASTCLRTNEDAAFITETEPGRMTGPIEKGLNTRFDDYKAIWRRWHGRDRRRN